MGVPAHNEIDYFFAKKYKLVIKYVLHYFQNRPEAKEKVEGPLIIDKEGYLINSKEFDYLYIDEAKELLIKHLELKGKAHFETTYKLRDWLVSRQRYWGSPIPIIYCASCGEVPVPEDQLPVRLPESFSINFKEGIPLETSNSFKNVSCPKCNSPAFRDTNTLDTFFDSSFYFLRFVDKNNTSEVISTEKLNEWLPVNIYIGGLEHAILHLLYSRFIYRFILDSKGILKKEIPGEKVFPAPFKEMITQGIIKGKTLIHKKTGRFLTKNEASTYGEDEVSNEFHKMSKSKLNGVNPIEEVEKYGIDAVRLMILFSGPIQQDINYEEELYKPILGFLKKLEKYYQTLSTEIMSFCADNILNELKNEDIANISIQLVKLYSEVVAKIGERSFHVAIARLMEIVNLLTENRNLILSNGKNFTYIFSVNLLVLLYPFAPYYASEEYDKLKRLGNLKNEYIFYYNLEDEILNLQNMTKDLSDKVKITLQVNGKFKGMVSVKQDLSKDTDHILEEALLQIKGFSVERKEINKIIQPEKGNIMNLVTSQKKSKV